MLRGNTKITPIRLDYGSVLLGKRESPEPLDAYPSTTANSHASTPDHLNQVLKQQENGYKRLKEMHSPPPV
jgi:hypothetical protein